MHKNVSKTGVFLLKKEEKTSAIKKNNDIIEKM